MDALGRILPGYNAYQMKRLRFRFLVSFRVFIEEIRFTRNDYFLKNSRYTIYQKRNSRNKIKSMQNISDINQLARLSIEEKIKIYATLYQSLQGKYLETFSELHKRIVVRQITKLDRYEEVYRNIGYIDLPLHEMIKLKKPTTFLAPLIDDEHGVEAKLLIRVEVKVKRDPYAPGILARLGTSIYNFVFPHKQEEIIDRLSQNKVLLQILRSRDTSEYRDMILAEDREIELKQEIVKLMQESLRLAREGGLNIEAEGGEGVGGDLQTHQFLDEDLAAFQFSEEDFIDEAGQASPPDRQTLLRQISKHVSQRRFEREQAAATSAAATALVVREEVTRTDSADEMDKRNSKGSKKGKRGKKNSNINKSNATAASTSDDTGSGTNLHHPSHHPPLPSLQLEAAITSDFGYPQLSQHQWQQQQQEPAEKGQEEQERTPMQVQKMVRKAVRRLGESTVASKGGSEYNSDYSINTGSGGSDNGFHSPRQPQAFQDQSQEPIPSPPPVSSQYRAVRRVASNAVDNSQTSPHGGGSSIAGYDPPLPSASAQLHDGDNSTVNTSNTAPSTTIRKKKTRVGEGATSFRSSRDLVDAGNEASRARAIQSTAAVSASSAAANSNTAVANNNKPEARPGVEYVKPSKPISSGNDSNNNSAPAMNMGSTYGMSGYMNSSMAENQNASFNQPRRRVGRIGETTSNGESGYFNGSTSGYNLPNGNNFSGYGMMPQQQLPPQYPQMPSQRVSRMGSADMSRLQPLGSMHRMGSSQYMTADPYGAAGGGYTGPQSGYYQPQQDPGPMRMPSQQHMQNYQQGYGMHQQPVQDSTQYYDAYYRGSFHE